MIGLNKIFHSFDKLRYRFWEVLPEEKTDINNFINSVLQMFENLSYENKRGNTKRYIGMKGDVQVESMLFFLNKNLRKINRIDFKLMDTSLSEFDAKLEHILWDVLSARKSIKRLISKLENKLQ